MVDTVSTIDTGEYAMENVPREVAMKQCEQVVAGIAKMRDEQIRRWFLTVFPGYSNYWGGYIGI